jgi:nucleoid-associated protein YgaU
MEVAKAGPEASGPAPEQPVTENMTQNVQTAEPTPMEVAKAGPEASGPASEQPVTENMTQYVQTAEPLTAEVAQAGPEVSVPAPEQPVTEIKTQDVKTAAAISGEQAARAMGLGKPRSGKIVIQPGNNLWKLSRVIYGRGLNFTVIYQANKDQIRDPDWIYPGQIFAIPNASPPEKIDPKRKDPLTSAEGGVVQ